jgi:hypothetical protein
LQTKVGSVFLALIYGSYMLILECSIQRK